MNRRLRRVARMAAARPPGRSADRHDRPAAEAPATARSAAQSKGDADPGEPGVNELSTSGEQPSLPQTSTNRPPRGVRDRAQRAPPVSYKVSEAAQVSGLTTGVLYAAIRENRLEAFQPTPEGHMLILSKHLLAYITRYPVNARARAGVAPRECSVPCAGTAGDG